jgi:hypothetical protein
VIVQRDSITEREREIKNDSCVKKPPKTYVFIFGLVIIFVLLSEEFLLDCDISQELV